MPRLAVKLLLVDPQDRLLLIDAVDPADGSTYLYPVGGGVEPGESLHDAAAREAFEETGLTELPPGDHVWRRRHRYAFNGQVSDVHEEWTIHQVHHFTPIPAQLSPVEAQSILGFRWWSAAELTDTHQPTFPPNLAHLFSNLLADGLPTWPLDISTHDLDGPVATD